jgi:hypothetical protein
MNDENNEIIETDEDTAQEDQPSRVGEMPSKGVNMGTKLSRHFAHHQ